MKERISWFRKSRNVANTSGDIELFEETGNLFLPLKTNTAPEELGGVFLTTFTHRRDITRVIWKEYN